MGDYSKKMAIYYLNKAKEEIEKNKDTTKKAIEYISKAIQILIEQ